MSHGPNLWMVKKSKNKNNLKLSCYEPYEGFFVNKPMKGTSKNKTK